ncbi:hypothetical protein [Cohnella massiliensis]|uniref:hypothetical protein n=1 Tax=Paenibacillaceae TaxID=186822 RepID=UPI0009BB3586|nr:hypothetical protein [Cohnella massiliensis]
MGWIPELPTIVRTNGKDGKERLYIVASNELDIAVMLHAAGLFCEGIHRQNNAALNGYYRIIKPWEEAKLRSVFP